MGTSDFMMQATTDGNKLNELKRKTLALAKREGEYGWRIPKYFGRLSPLLDSKDLPQNIGQIEKIAGKMKETGIPALKGLEKSSMPSIGSMAFGAMVAGIGIYIAYMGKTVEQATTETLIRMCGVLFQVAGVFAAGWSAVFFGKIPSALKLKSFIRGAEKLIGEIESQVLGKKG